MALRNFAQRLVMLAAESLAFGYAGRPVGTNLAFRLEAGEVMCLLGPNGSGKTTLLRTLLGLLPPLGGRALLDGQDLASRSTAEIARVAAYVPQAAATPFPYSVLDTVLMGRAARLPAFSTPGRHDREIASSALERLGIGALAARPVTEISAGERQLALLARALAQEPKLLVMDEPTASLDFGNQVRVLERILSLSKSGIAILFSSHDPDHASLCAHRALLLSQGRVLALGTPGEVLREDLLQALYGVAVRVVPLDGRRVACVPAVP